MHNVFPNVFPNVFCINSKHHKYLLCDCACVAAACLFEQKWSHFFTVVFSSKFFPAEQEVGADCYLLFAKLQVSLVEELSDQKVVTQPPGSFHWAKSCLKNEMIPLGTELKSRFSRSKLLCTAWKVCLWYKNWVLHVLRSIQFKYQLEICVRCIFEQMHVHAKLHL